MTNNSQLPAVGPRLWSALGAALLIQCLFISCRKKKKKKEVLCNYPIPNEINIPWHFPVNG